jgi:hypothetical protein
VSWTLLVALLAALPGAVMGASVDPALAPVPNDSIIFYKPPTNGKPGRAVTGTLADGVYTRKRAFTTRRWTSIAVGRDSMAFYDRGTGKLLTGRFRNGIWKPLKSRTIAKGYTHVVASCDSILFYRRSTDSGKTAEFTSGEVRNMRNLAAANPGPGFDYHLVASSCDTVKLLGTRDSSGNAAVSGLLDNGRYQLGFQAFGGAVTWTHLATSTDSYLELSPPRGAGAGTYGLLVDGLYDSDDDTIPCCFGADWDIIAGASDTLLFYMRSGVASLVILEGGEYQDLPPLGRSLGRAGASSPAASDPHRL